MKASQQYIDIYGEYEELICERSPAFMNVPRQSALKAFKHLGFPAFGADNYRYTSVSEAFAPDYGLNFNRYKTLIDTAEVFNCDVPNMTTQLFFIVNDAFYEEAVPKRPLPEGVFAGSMFKFERLYPDKAAQYYGKAAFVEDNALTALNTMLTQDGFVLYVSKDVLLERPVQLINIFRNKVDVMANRRILIIMEAGSQAKLLVCDHSLDDVHCISNQVVEIFVEEGASFDYYDLEESTSQTKRFATLYAEQASRSNVLITGMTLTNGLTRNNYYINLNGADAETSLCGMAVQDGAQQVDTYTYINHKAPRCKSMELFKNVLDDSAIGVFNGRIKVSKAAQKTEACQTNRNICFAREARMYSKPQLEIYADDVKCSHGMSTGQIDEAALFYMQSRGLSREEAGLLLSVAFTSEVTDKVRLPALKERLRFLTEKRFRGELARCRGCCL
jgi:Fe-S cluster assembly protein SufD